MADMIEPAGLRPASPPPPMPNRPGLWVRQLEPPISRASFEPAVSLQSLRPRPVKGQCAATAAPSQTFSNPSPPPRSKSRRASQGKPQLASHKAQVTAITSVPSIQDALCALRLTVAHFHRTV